MQDLTKIDVPFGHLDKETQERLKAHGGPYEQCEYVWPNRFICLGGWRANPHPEWDKNIIYRVKQQSQLEVSEKPGLKIGSLRKFKSDGRIAELLAVAGDYVFCKFIDEQDGFATPVMYWFEDYKPYTTPRKCEAWVNVYADGNRYRFGITNYANEQNARDEGSADELYIATVKIEYVESKDDA